MPNHPYRAPRCLAASVGIGALAATLIGLPAQAEPKLEKVAGFEHQVTGVTVTKDGRVFVSFPPVDREQLSDKTLAGKVATVGENGPADGLIVAQDGKMYVTGPQDDSVKVRDLSAAGATPTVLLKDKQLRWPDTFSEASDGTLYLTTSHIQDSAFYKQGAPIALPTELWRFKPNG